jgi:hypothetical protein
MYAALDAMAHIKRAPIDQPPWGYDLDKLRDMEPFGVAAYVAALTIMEHEDETEAREILEEALDDRDHEAGLYAELTDHLLALSAQVQQDVEERKAHWGGA